MFGSSLFVAAGFPRSAGVIVCLFATRGNEFSRGGRRIGLRRATFRNLTQVRNADLA
jgi:hypothetical protein